MTAYVFPPSGETARGASHALVDGILYVPDWRHAQIASFDIASSRLTTQDLQGAVTYAVSPIVQNNAFFSGTDFAGSTSFEWNGQTLTGETLALVNDTTTGYSSVSGLLTSWIASEAAQEVGYCAAAVGDNSDFWALGYGEGLLHYTPSSSGGVSYALPFGETFCGLAMNSGLPYFLSTAGQVYTVLDGRPTRVEGGNLAAVCTAWRETQGIFYALSPSGPNLLPFTLGSTSSGSSGAAISVPIALPYSFSSSGGVLGVVGTTPAQLALTGNAMAYIPLSKQILVAQDAANAVVVLEKNAANDWAQVQSVAGGGGPLYLAPTPNAEQCLISNSSSGVVQILNQTDGTWGTPAAQTLALAGCGAAAVTMDNAEAFVCQPASNQLSVLTNTSNTWAIGYTLPLTGAQSVMVASSGVAYAGGSSGIATLGVINGQWTQTAFASTTYPVESLAIDAFGGVYAAGSSGGVGYLTAFYGNVAVGGASWTGSSDAVAWYNGQILVLDQANDLLRTFGLVGGQYAQQATWPAPPSSSGIVQLDTSWFVGGTALWEYEWGAPYAFLPVQVATIGIYDVATAAWTTATLGRGRRAFASTFDASLNLWVADDTNTLTAYSSGGTQISQAAIATYPKQQASTPLGFGSLLWDGGVLYGTSVLNNAVGVGI